MQGAEAALPPPSQHGHPDSDHSCVPPDYRSLRGAPPAWLPWALITLFPPLSLPGLKSVIAEITHADIVKRPKLQRRPEKEREK